MIQVFHGCLLRCSPFLLQHELLRVLYPVFIHCFMDLVAKGHIQEGMCDYESMYVWMNVSALFFSSVYVVVFGIRSSEFFQCLP